MSLHGGSRGKERKKEQVEMPRAMIQGVLANFSSFDYLISQILGEMMGNAILVTNRFRGLKGQIPDMVVGDLTIMRKIIKLPGKGNAIRVGITLPALQLKNTFFKGLLKVSQFLLDFEWLLCKITEDYFKI